MPRSRAQHPVCRTLTSNSHVTGTQALLPYSRRLFVHLQGGSVVPVAPETPWSLDREHVSGPSLGPFPTPTPWEKTPQSETVGQSCTYTQVSLLLSSEINSPDLGVWGAGHAKDSSRYCFGFPQPYPR